MMIGSAGEFQKLMVREEGKKSTALTRDLVQKRMTMFCGEKNSTKRVLANGSLRKKIQKGL